MPQFKRVVLKLSGEALAAADGFGVDADRARPLVNEIAQVAGLGVELGIVVGGGNFFRGLRASATGLRRISVDYMGMLGTVMNSLALADFLKDEGLDAQVMSATEMQPFAERFTPRGARAYMQAGKVVLFAGGTGSPFFSTDSAAALRAAEIGADLVAKATKVDGVYDRDPIRFPEAKRYDKISYLEVLSGRLAVMDTAAIALCQENNLPIVVFDMNAPGNMKRVALGEKVGTLIS